MRFWPHYGRKRRDQDLDQEIQAHLAMAARDRVEQGETSEAAERAARREFGNRAAIQEITREMWGWNTLELLRQDARYALRTMRRAPAFTAVAALSLGLGIGANAAIFSLVNTLMLRMLPVRDPQQLVEPLHRFQDEPHFNGFSWQSYRYFVERNRVFSGLIGTYFVNYDSGPFFHVRGEGAAVERVDGVCVTGNFFPVLGVKPALGRLIAPEDDRLDAPAAVAVVSWAYWKNRFNLDRAILGKRIVVDGAPVAIVGVAARGFQGLSLDYRQDLWLPLAMQPVLQPTATFIQRQGGGLILVGRLRSGVSMEQARAQMTVLFRQAAEAEPNSRINAFLRAMKFEMEPAGAGLSRVRDQFARPLVVLMGVVGLLLLIACTNVASMLLARGAARQREMALRVSLGAGRWRLVRQVLTESLLISAAGMLLGILLAYFGTSALVRIIGSGRERLEIHVAVDAHVLLFTAGAALLAGLLFGLAPALRAWGTAPASSLRDAGRAGDTRLRRLFGQGLVVAQVALSVVLLSAAGLFIRYLSNIYAALGFERDHVLLVVLDPSRSGYTRAQLADPYRELLERLQAIPAVRSATLSGVTPTQGAGANRDATVEGYQAKPGELRYLAENWVAPKYFETFGTPLLRGRDFTFEDQGRSRVAIINQTMARYYFGDGNPLGKHVLFDGETQPYEIVGVVGDAKYTEAREGVGRTIYFNAFQEGRISSQFSLRTRGAPAAVAADVRRTVHEEMKTVTVQRIKTLADQVDASIVPERLIATLSGLFGILGSVLAAIGLYGLLAYTVARRINEIGVRMALGATRGDVTRMVLGEALGMVAAGLLAAVPMALWGRRFAASLVQNLPVQSAFPIAFGAVAMIAIALLAAFVPARRAASVDPMEALRYE